jgi:HSP20 family protein
MNRHIVKKSLIGVGLLALVGAVGAQTYYTHEVAQKFKLAENSQQAAPQDPIDDNWDPWSGDDLFSGNDPWTAIHNDMLRIQENMNREWARAMDEFHHLPGNIQMPVEGRIELQEQDDNYVVTAEIPGAKKSDININLDGRLLSISSKTQGMDKRTDANDKVIEQDRYASAFQQAFTLPGPVNAVGIHSDFKDGVLTVTIPKLSG